MKIYKVIFNKYTGGMCDTVWNETKDKYIDIGNKHEFLCKESDIDFLKQYGEGFRKIELVGELFKSPTTKTGELLVNIQLDTEEIENQIKEYTAQLKECECCPINLNIENITINKDIDINKLAEEIKRKLIKETTGKPISPFKSPL